MSSAAPRATDDAVATVTDTRPTGTAGGRIPHLPALDGLRGLAVIAVIAYHCDVLPGGFLGVDLFFVLSGFLITSLLLAEHRDSGRISLRTFWARRFRRLLPALLLFIAAATLWGAFLADPEVRTTIRNDALAGLAYVTNWWFVASGVSYAGSFSAPSPFRHLWSLAVEEQYYLLWPLVVVACTALGAVGAGLHRRRLVVVSVIGFVASAGWMALLAATGTGTDRMYFGTDTRAATILAGVVLALVLERHLTGSGGDTATTSRRRWPVAVVAGLGLIGLITAVVVAEQQDRWLYQFGFPLVAVCAAAVIAGAVLLEAPARVLSARWLRWTGERSYGLYLWHWLVLVALLGLWPGAGTLTRLVVVCVVAGAAAEVSYRLVERPIRTHGVPARRPVLAAVGATAAVAALALFTGFRAAPPPEYLTTRPPDDLEMRPPPAGPTTTAAPDTPVAAPTTLPTTPQAPPPTLPGPTRVLLVGDSVAASLADALGTSLGDRGVAYASAAYAGCGLLEGDPAGDDGSVYPATAACSDAIPRNQRDAVARTGPDLVVALSSWEAATRNLDGVWYPFATPESDRMILDLYRRAVDRLTAGGARVALVRVPDPVPSDRGPVDPEQLERIRHMNELIDSVAADDPIRVSVVHLDEIVCPGTGDCPTEVDGLELRGRDGAHFAEPATAAWVAERLAERIVTVPRGDVR